LCNSKNNGILEIGFVFPYVAHILTKNRFNLKLDKHFLDKPRLRQIIVPKNIFSSEQKILVFVGQPIFRISFHKLFTD